MGSSLAVAVREPGAPGLAGTLWQAVAVCISVLHCRACRATCGGACPTYLPLRGPFWVTRRGPGCVQVWGTKVHMATAALVSACRRGAVPPCSLVLGHPCGRRPKVGSGTCVLPWPSPVRLCANRSGHLGVE